MSSRRLGGSSASPPTMVRTTFCLVQGEREADYGRRQLSTYVARHVDGRRVSPIQVMATALNGETNYFKLPGSNGARNAT
eukprot:6809433-Pyramimonas_sp.AAC.1